MVVAAHQYKYNVVFTKICDSCRSLVGAAFPDICVRRVAFLLAAVTSGAKCASSSIALVKQFYCTAVCVLYTIMKGFFFLS